MIAIPRIETKRPTLLDNLESDPHATHDYLSKDRMSFITGPFDDVGTWRTRLASLGHWQLCGFGFWHSKHRESGKMAGTVSFLHHLDWPETELGWNMHHDFEGAGLAHDATLIVQPSGETHLNITCVISYLDPANTRSAALAKRLGATFVKTHFLSEYECHVYRHPLGEAPKKATQLEANQ